MTSVPPADSQERITSSRAKLWLCLGAWGLAGGAILASDPARVALAPFFPVGLIAMLPNGEEKAITGYMLVYPCLLGWGIYVALGAWLSRVKRWPSFLYAYLVLCTVLALNVSGCKKALEAAAGIR